MWDLDKTSDRKEVWRFMTGVIQYLDNSLTFVTAEDLKEIMAAQGIKQFSLKLLMSMVSNGNIACYEAMSDKGDAVRYFCSTKYSRVVPSASP